MDRASAGDGKKRQEEKIRTHLKKVSSCPSIATLSQAQSFAFSHHPSASQVSPTWGIVANTSPTITPLFPPAGHPTGPSFIHLGGESPHRILPRRRRPQRVASPLPSGHRPLPRASTLDRSFCRHGAAGGGTGGAFTISHTLFRALPVSPLDPPPLQESLRRPPYISWTTSFWTLLSSPTSADGEGPRGDGEDGDRRGPIQRLVQPVFKMGRAH